jgi:hypothetical protein
VYRLSIDMKRHRGVAFDDGALDLLHGHASKPGQRSGKHTRQAADRAEARSLLDDDEIETTVVDPSMWSDASPVAPLGGIGEGDEQGASGARA